MESKQMVWWAGLALIGFLLLIAVVVVLGLVSTDRYEQERARRAARPRLPRTAPASPAEPRADGERRRPGEPTDPDR
jgi:hypothetical protein